MKEPKGKLAEMRCNKCGGLLFKGDIKQGVVEVKCKCGHTNNITFEKKEQEGAAFVIHMLPE